MSVAAASHTQPIRANLCFRRTSAFEVKAEMELALVAEEGASEMDTSEKEAAAFESGWNVAGAGGFAPEEHGERVLRLFRSSGLDEVVDITQQRILDDPHEQLLALYKEYRPRLFAYLYSLYLDQDEADEVIQETFLLLTGTLRQENGIENVPGWIVRVSHHLAVDVLKRKKRHMERMRTVTPFQLDSVTDPRDTPEQSLLKADQKRQIDIALAQFKPEHRQCFYMRSQGFRYKDIAMALQISEQRVNFIVKNMTIRLAVLCG